MPLGLSFLFCHEYVPAPRSRTFVDSIPHLVGRRTVPQERRNERHGILHRLPDAVRRAGQVTTLRKALRRDRLITGSDVALTPACSGPIHPTLGCMPSHLSTSELEACY